jgi:hypothetical protein
MEAELAEVERQSLGEESVQHRRLAPRPEEERAPAPISALAVWTFAYGSARAMTALDGRSDSSAGRPVNGIELSRSIALAVLACPRTQRSRSPARSTARTSACTFARCVSTLVAS